MSNADDCRDAPLPDGPTTAARAAAQHLGVRGFVALWHGERPRVAALIDDPALVHAEVRAGRLEVDDAGYLVGAHGLVMRITRHRIEHAGGVVHTWCALDAIGIPAALAIDATSVTTCPTCEAELRVVLRGGEPVDVGESWRLWLPGGRCDHLIDDFCSHANLYCSRDHLTAAVPDTSPGRMVTVADAAATGRHVWKDAAGALGSEGVDR